MAMATTTGRPFLAEAPSVVKLLPLYLRLVLLLDVLFVAVYGGLNWLTARREGLVGLYFDWETRLPFVPGMIYAYLSINVLFVLPLFVLDERGMRLLARRIAWAIVLSGAVFLLLPARLGFVRPAAVPGYQAVYSLLYAIDRPHNLFPSLHVAYSTLIVAALCGRASGPARALLVGWLGLIAAAVVLVHQHHLADVAGGFAVAWITSVATKEDAS
jgi:membrane-associated phospholipid phosphatase